MLTVVCVRTGTKYGVDYVWRLRNMVARHLPIPHEFICFTDQPERPAGMRFFHTDRPGWWAKMLVFCWPTWSRRLYFDLDTVIVGDLTPLAEWDGEFGICENFTKLAGHNSWDCNYGSCVMSLAPGWGMDVWNAFNADDKAIMESCPRGDQQAIERLAPGATYLQDVTPPGYFLGYRDLTDSKPEGCSVVVFAGSRKPDNCPHQWIKDEWK